MSRSRVPLLPPDEEALLEAFTVRVAELLEQRAAPPQLVDAKTLAGMLSVSVTTVYENVERLGGVELPGTGKRRLIRFDVEKALMAWIPCGTGERSQPAQAQPVRPAARRRRAAARPDSKLLPVRGDEP